MTGSITVCTTHVPIVVGSYARLIRKGDGDSDSNRYEWTVVVHIDGRIHGDLGNYVDKIDFFLHKSFAIVCKPCYSYQPSVQPNRRCTKAPFFISDEGWGEFPVGLELTLRHGGNLKLTHYLKLDSPDPIIVNQTFETLILPRGYPHPDQLLVTVGTRIPLVDEYHARCQEEPVSSHEDKFLEANHKMISTLQSLNDDLLRRALASEMELYATRSKRM